MVLERAILFRKSRSDFDGGRALGSKRRPSKNKRRFANWPRRSTNYKRR
jgi:hypothetical protein